MSDFLPKGFEIPERAGNYVRLQEGENNFRILSSAILGYVRWADDVKRLDGSLGRGPIRKRMDEDLEVEYGYGGSGGWRHFWALVVYNYEAEKIQVWEITQKTIMRKIRTLTRSKDWGDPQGYDVVVMRNKTGPEARDVEYDVLPKPKAKFKEKTDGLEKIDLEALYSGEDPFVSERIEGEEVPF